MDIQRWGPDEFSAAAAVLGLGVAVVVAVFAAIQVLQAKKLREEQARPYVIVDFDFRRFLAQIAISNIGSTPAKNVTISFDKPLQTASPGRPDLNQATIFTAPIPMIAPGRQMLVTLDSLPNLFKDGTVALSYTATAKYKDSRGKNYDENFPLDLLPFKNTPIPPEDVPEIAQHLKDLHLEVKKVIAGGHVRVKSATWTLSADVKHADTTYIAANKSSRKADLRGGCVGV